MIKKTITFDDLDGNEITEDHYFHLSNTELLEWGAAAGDGKELAEQMEETVKSGNAPEIMRLFNKIVHKSYGAREGATVFKKSPELADQFMTSLAFDALFTELLTNGPSAIAFINGIIPSKLVKQIEASQGANPGQLALSQVENESADDVRTGLKRPRDDHGNLLPWANRKPSQVEQRSMTKAQMQDVMNRMNSGWEPTVQSV
jgi:hypothetical protein